MNIYNITNQLNSVKPLIPLNLNKVFFLIIHHTGSSNDYTWQSCNMDHKANGWDCLGYNEMIYQNGDVYICRDLNVGAQCSNMNSKSYGISLIGNYDKEATMPSLQFNSLVERIRYNKSRFPNTVEIVPHSRFCPTSCPGKNFPLEPVIQAVENIPTQLMQDVAVLKRNCLISSPQYWLDNAVSGQSCRGEFVGALIHNVANKFR